MTTTTTKSDAPTDQPRDTATRIAQQLAARRQRAEARDACRGELDALEGRIATLEAARDGHQARAAEAKKAQRAAAAEMNAGGSPEARGEHADAVDVRQREEGAAEAAQGRLVPLYEDRGKLRRNYAALCEDVDALDAVLGETVRGASFAALVEPWEATFLAMVDDLERTAAKHWPRLEAAAEAVAPALAEFQARGGTVPGYGAHGTAPAAVFGRAARAVVDRLRSQGFGKRDHLADALRAR